MDNNTQARQAQQDTSVQIKDILLKCLSKWYWFVISVILCLGVAFYYLLSTPPTYTRSAEIMIKSNRSGRSIGADEQISELGLFSSNTNVYNEMKAIAAKANMIDVARHLHLDMNYITDGRFHDNVLYGTSLPVQAEVLDVADGAAFKFDMDVKGDGTVILSDFKDKEDQALSSGLKVTGVFADTLSTPVGDIVVNPTTSFESEDLPTIHVRRSSLKSAGSRYSSHLNVSLSDKMSQVVHLSFTDISVQRAEDVLNALVDVYNENWVADKNQVAVSTSMFINDRLDVIEQELANVDSDISSYKSENLVPDIKAASSMYMNQSNAINNQITELNNELYMTRYIREYITNDANRNKLLPANSGIKNTNIENQIRDYNDKVLARNDLVATSSATNPLVLESDNAIESLRQAIVTSVDNQVLALNNQISSLQRNERQATARIAANPTQAKYLLSVERQQSVKEALYLFLLQKREENELSQAFTAYNTRLIDPPSGSSSPTAPRRSMIMLMALLIGLCIPLGIIYLLEALNTKVRGRADLKDVKMPFAGEIPYAGPIKIKKNAQTDSNACIAVVKPGSRNVINEAFRVLRTNVEFMSHSDDSRVISITSYNPASGKSFNTFNLALALAIKDKKVLAIDCDLRHASLSAAIGSPKKGLSSYLNGQVYDIPSLFVQYADNPNLFILPVGIIPPNPSELIADSRFEEMIDKARQDFDYVLLDCPPIEIVADTQLIDRCVDRTLFVIRAGMYERGLLPELNRIYEENKYKNLALILNGTEIASTRTGGKYGYRYGYRYAYHYGHYGQGSAYDYGNGDDEDSKKA